MYNELKRQHKRKYLYFEKIFLHIPRSRSIFQTEWKRMRKSRKSVKSKPIIYDPVCYKFSDVVFESINTKVL